MSSELHLHVVDSEELEEKVKIFEYYDYSSRNEDVVNIYGYREVNINGEWIDTRLTDWDDDNITIEDTRDIIFPVNIFSDKDWWDVINTPNIRIGEDYDNLDIIYAIKDLVSIDNFNITDSYKVECELVSIIDEFIEKVKEIYTLFYKFNKNRKYLNDSDKVIDFLVQNKGKKIIGIFH
jgi:hypothetical protein